MLGASKGRAMYSASEYFDVYKIEWTIFCSGEQVDG